MGGTGCDPTSEHGYVIDDSVLNCGLLVSTTEHVFPLALELK